MKIPELFCQLPLTPLTCWQLQTPVDCHPWTFALPYIHGKLQTSCVCVYTIGQGEAHLVHSPADDLGCVYQQLIQNILVREGWALLQDATALQWLRVKLTST